jgi:molybdenum cofactor cytidylyltransferase
MSSVISAVVFAAGTSTRMGSPKLLLPLGGEPIVRRTVRQVSEAGFDDVLVVLGCEHSRILDALEGLSVRNTINRDYETGMGSSFRAAVLDLQDSAASMFALADQPFVTSAHYRQLLETYHRQLSGIVCVRYGDVTAPPHLFDKEFFPELAKLEHGAKPVLQRHRDQTTVLEFPPELLLDVDTPEDYEAALARIRNANL